MTCDWYGYCGDDTEAQARLLYKSTGEVYNLCEDHAKVCLLSSRNDEPSYKLLELL